MAGINHEPRDYKYDYPEPEYIDCPKCEGRGYIFIDVPAVYIEDETDLCDIDTQECSHCGGEGFINLLDD